MLKKQTEHEQVQKPRDARLQAKKKSYTTRSRLHLCCHILQTVMHLNYISEHNSPVSDLVGDGAESVCSVDATVHPEIG